ncbi:MAG: 23S rRNA (adenine(2503)-C(2))-methyltransferase RlmN [Phycisphaerae bacterium]
MENEKQYLLDFDLEELEGQMVELNEPEYRAGQIFQWIYRRRVPDFDQMSNIGKLLRIKLAEKYFILGSQPVMVRDSADGTRKMLLDFGNKVQVEAVLIPAKEHLTACLSTQSGCPVKCVFCASGQGEYGGNLTAGQIAEELLQLQILADQTQERISNIVFMGMGEPLLNYENTIKAIRIINSDWGLNIGARRMTISTVGIPDKIRQLAHEKMQFNLALSLHAVDQKLREQLIPLAKKYSLRDIFDATVYFFEKTHREVTLEYLLLKDVNCNGSDADVLAEMARTIRANVNLIVYNPTENDPFQAPTKQSVMNFLNHLKRLNVNVHMRASRGQDIEAACGQLKHKMTKP